MNDGQIKTVFKDGESDVVKVQESSLRQLT